jgi:hypothetical protein
VAGIRQPINAESDTAYFKSGAYTQANCSNSSPSTDGNYGNILGAVAAVCAATQDPCAGSASNWPRC